MEKLVPGIALGLTLGLGLTACGEAVPEPDNKSQITKDNSNGIDKKIQYFDDGTRIIHLSGSTRSGERIGYPVDIYAFCDGNDLVEETLGHRGYPAGSIARTVGHAACADGRLTASDFEK